jgi:hypothetical protein
VHSAVGMCECKRRVHRDHGDSELRQPRLERLPARACHRHHRCSIDLALVLCVLGASTLNALAPRLCQDTFQDGGVRLLVLPGASISVSSSRKRRELNVKCARELVQRAEQHGG